MWVGLEVDTQSDFRGRGVEVGGDNNYICLEKLAREKVWQDGKPREKRISNRKWLVN